MFCLIQLSHLTTQLSWFCKKRGDFDRNMFIFKSHQNIDQNQVICTRQKLRNASFIWCNIFCCVITKQKSAVAYKGVLVLSDCNFPSRMWDAVTDSDTPFLPLHLFPQPFHWLPARWKPSCAWSVTRERKENIFCRKAHWPEEVGVYIYILIYRSSISIY